MNAIKKQHLANNLGFTIIELIVVIVLIGILGAMGAGFISETFKGFRDTDVRMQIYEEGKAALFRMERELHIALPNAVNIVGNSITFGLIDTQVMSTPNVVFGQYTETNPVGGLTISDRTNALPAETTISIYNTNWANFNGGNSLYRVASAAGSQMTLDAPIAQSSPSRRFYAVRPQAVRYNLNGTTLQRDTAGVTSGGVGGFNVPPRPLANDVIQTGGLPLFTYTAGSTQRNSLVTIHFSITRNNETVNFHKEIQIRNIL